MDYIKEMAGDYVYSLSELPILSNVSGSVMSLLGGYVKMAAGRLASPEDLANMYSAGDYVYSLSELPILSNVSGSVMSLLGGYVKMAAGRLASPEDLANMYSLEQKLGDITHRLWNGQAQTM